MSEKKAAAAYSAAFLPAGRHSPAVGLSRAGSGASTPAHDPSKLVLAPASKTAVIAISSTLQSLHRTVFTHSEVSREHAQKGRLAACLRAA